jgi:hypothetical protein
MWLRLYTHFENQIQIVAYSFEFTGKLYTKLTYETGNHICPTTSRPRQVTAISTPNDRLAAFRMVPLTDSILRSLKKSSESMSPMISPQGSAKSTNTIL